MQIRLVHAPTIIIWACFRVIFDLRIIAMYLLRVMNVVDVIDNARVATIKPAEIRHPSFPVVHPPALKTMTIKETEYILNIISAQHKLNMNSVSTDFCRTRKMDAITSVSDRDPNCRNCAI